METVVGRENKLNIEQFPCWEINMITWRRSFNGLGNKSTTYPKYTLCRSTLVRTHLPKIPTNLTQIQMKNTTTTIWITPQFQLIQTPNSFWSLAPAAMLLSPKPYHWSPSYQAVTSPQHLGQLTTLQGGPALFLRSVTLLYISLSGLPVENELKTSSTPSIWRDLTFITNFT